MNWPCRSLAEAQSVSHSFPSCPRASMSSETGTERPSGPRYHSWPSQNGHVPYKAPRPPSSDRGGDVDVDGEGEGRR